MPPASAPPAAILETALHAADLDAAYLLPAIAAVVLGGTRILGGNGRHAGTVVGVILIVLLNSVLSIMQMPEAGRQIIDGVVVVAMLLVHGRSAKVTS